jgi:hypothetical protein
MQVQARVQLRWRKEKWQAFQLLQAVKALMALQPQQAQLACQPLLPTGPHESPPQAAALQWLWALGC